MGKILSINFDKKCWENTEVSICLSNFWLNRPLSRFCAAILLFIFLFHVISNLFLNFNCMPLQQANFIQLLHSLSTLSLWHHQVAYFIHAKDNNMCKKFPYLKCDLTEVNNKTFYFIITCFFIKFYVHIFETLP